MFYESPRCLFQLRVVLQINVVTTRSLHSISILRDTQSCVLELRHDIFRVQINNGEVRHFTGDNGYSSLGIEGEQLFYMFRVFCPRLRSIRLEFFVCNRDFRPRRCRNNTPSTFRVLDRCFFLQLNSLFTPLCGMD